MPHWKVTLAYDGTNFHGWQVQPGLPTVQGTLASAIASICGEQVLPQGSGRTDAGVHALAQVASFSLQTAIPTANLHRALNHRLPPSIRILSVDPASPEFHARHSARRKTYEYRIFPRRHPLAMRARPGTPPPETHICSPMLAPFVWDTGLLLSLPALEQAAAYVLGTHDFTSFAAAGPPPESQIPSTPHKVHTSGAATTCRTIFHSAWRLDGHLLTYRVTGTGFLHNMVRNLVGTFVDAGAGRLDPDAMPHILAQRSRSAAGPTSPARGLFLVEVEY